MPAEEVEQLGVVLVLMLFPVEAMAFGFVVQGFHWNPGCLQTALHQFRMLNRRSLILATRCEEDRHFDAIRHIGRRNLGHLAALADPFPDIGFSRSGSLYVATGMHHRQVVHTDVANRALIEIRFFGYAGQRRVSTIAGPIDADAARVGYTRLYRPA